MKNKVYSLSEYVKILKESQEFKPKMGKNVESEDKKNNGKAVNDILKQCKEFDGGLSDEKEKKKENSRLMADHNKSLLDFNFAYPPSEEYKERVKKLVISGGLPESVGDTEGNKRFYDEVSKTHKEMSARKEALKKSGLQSRELAEEYPDMFASKSLFTNESKKMKRLNFSKTVFLNEEAMLKKIPDDMKINGNKFFMKDSIGNEYLIECVEDKVIRDIVHTNIIGYENKQKLDEAFDKMKHLYSYKSSEANGKSAINESSDMRSSIDKTKNFVNQKPRKEIF